jgi:hypothetical protein
MLATTAVVEAGVTTVVDRSSDVGTERSSRRRRLWRVSSMRVGVIGTNRPALSSVAEASTDQPATSAIKSAPPDITARPTAGANRNHDEVCPCLASDEVEVGHDGSIDPVGHAVTKPSAVA